MVAVIPAAAWGWIPVCVVMMILVGISRIALPKHDLGGVLAGAIPELSAGWLVASFL